MIEIELKKIYDDVQQIKVDENEIKKFKNESKFSELGVELAKEIVQLFIITLSIHTQGCVGLSRDNAILYALLVRLSKLFRSIIENYCSRKTETVQILNRCFIETYIDVLCLIKEDKKEIYEDYLKYSLKEDVKLLNTIEENIKQRGFELAIETRMKKSILNVCEKANISIVDVENFKKHSWIYNSIFDRFQKMQKGIFYESTYRMCSHSIHGRWTDIYMFNLKEKNGLYEINLDFREPNLKILTPTALCLADVLLTFIEYIFPKEMATVLSPRIIDNYDNILLLEKEHELFVINHY